MVSYDSILHVTSVGMKSTESFSLNPVVVQELNNRQSLLPPPVVQKFLSKATVDSVLLAAESSLRTKLRTSRLLLAVLEK